MTSDAVESSSTGAVDCGSTGPALLLITQQFPYGNSEQFLPVELAYLARSFASITLMPAKAKAGKPVSVPESCGLSRTLSDALAGRTKGWLGIWAQLIRLIRSNLGHKDSSVRARQRYGVLVHKARKAAVARRVVKTWVRQHRGCVVAYAYWMDEVALGVASGTRPYKRAVSIVRGHGFDLYDARQWHPEQACLMNLVDKAFVVSQHGVDYLRNKHPLFVDKIILGRLGVTDCGVGPEITESGRCCVVSCSSLVPVKRPVLMAKAVAALGRKVTTPIVWHHFGDGPLAEDVQRVCHAEMPDSVEVRFHGQVANEVVRSFYATTPVDIFLNLSSTEGAPVSIMEALCAGIPVVATAVGGTPELVGREAGVVLDPGCSAEMAAKAMATVFGIQREDSGMRDAARDSWRRKAQAAVVFPDQVNRILSVLQSSSAGICS